VATGRAVKRFLTLWSVLAATLVPVTIASSFIFYRHIDLTNEAFAQLIIVPACQALVMAAATTSVGPFVQAARSTLAHPLANIVLITDVAMVGLGWAFLDQRLLGFAGLQSVQPTWTGTKAMAAGAFLWSAVLSDRGAPSSWSETLTLAGFGCLVTALGANALYPWLGDLPAWLFSGVRPLPRVLQWMAVYGGLFVVALGMAMRTAAVVGTRSVAPTLHFELAAGVAFVAAIIVTLNVFRHPYLVEPWRSIAQTLSSMCATFVLTGAILASGSGRHGTRADPEAA
jgi:hypothetical protein